MVLVKVTSRAGLVAPTKLLGLTDICSLLAGGGGGGRRCGCCSLLARYDIIGCGEYPGYGLGRPSPSTSPKCTPMNFKRLPPGRTHETATALGKKSTMALELPVTIEFDAATRVWAPRSCYVSLQVLPAVAGTGAGAGPGAVRTLGVKIDTGSSALVLVSDRCEQCSLQRGEVHVGVGPMTVVRRIQYGSKVYTARETRVRLALGGGHVQVVSVVAGIVVRAAPCPDPTVDARCNVSIGGLLPGAEAGSLPSLVDQLFAQLPSDTRRVLTLRLSGRGSSALVLGQDAISTKAADNWVPLMTPAQVRGVFGRTTPMPWFFVVELQDIAFGPGPGAGAGGGRGGPWPRHALIDCGSNILGGSGAFVTRVTSLISGRTGVLRLVLSPTVSLAVRVTSREQMVANTVPLFENPPYRDLCIVGLSALINNAMSFSLDPDAPTLTISPL